MNDDELTRLFRSLEEQAEPDQAFNESLFARLEREAHVGSNRRRTSARWILLAAALLVAAALGAAAAVGSGLIKFPIELAVASPTPSPSASTAESATPIPSATASASATLLPTASIPESTYIDRLVAIPDGFLAIGSASGTNPPTSAVSVILRGSSDGATWQSMDATRFGEVVDMAVRPSAWILVSNTHRDRTGKWVVWRSTDGQTWSSDANWTTDMIESPVSAGSGPAGFMISGRYIIGPGRSRPTVWSSRDGTRWTRASIATDVDSAIVLDNGFLAYQSGNGGTAAVFASLDGVAWEPVSFPTGTPSNQVNIRILRVGTNLVAITCESLSITSACSAWSGQLEGSAGSPTVHWQAEAALSQQLHGYNLTSATGTDNGGFLFGYDQATYRRVVWTSTDGLSWTNNDLAADALGGGAPAGFAVGSSAVVVLGWTDSTLAGTGRMLFASSDGVSWTPALAPLLPPAPQVPTGSCPAAPTTVQQLAVIGLVKAASCYGAAPLTLHGYSTNCGGCGGTGPLHVTPDWLGGAYGTWYVSPAVTQPGSPDTRIPVYLMPSANLTPPSEGTPVTFTGHFNDVASQDCRWVSVAIGYELPPNSDAVARCQHAFVVTAISIAGS